MKRKWCGWILVAVIVLMTGLTACGQKGTSGKLTAASGGAGDFYFNYHASQHDENMPRAGKIAILS